MLRLKLLVFKTEALIYATRACTSKERNASCVYCRMAGKKGDHAASNVNCSTYKKVLEATVARTQYK